jgi:hypothetical protein
MEVVFTYSDFEYSAALLNLPKFKNQMYQKNADCVLNSRQEHKAGL